MPFLFLVALLLSTPFVADAAAKKRSIDTTRYAEVCTALNRSHYPPLKPNDKRRHKALASIIEASGVQNLLLKESPRLKAACWIMYDDSAKLSAGDPRLLERYALAVLYHATQGMQWTRSTKWLTGAHEGKWEGITISRPTFLSVKKRITSIKLPFNKVNGILPRELSLLTEMRVLDLHGNDLQGVLPHKALTDWKKLEVLELHINNILGKIPTEIGMMKNLKELHLFGTYIEGPLPRRIGELQKLEYLDVSFTYMSGSVPSELGNAMNLREVYLNDCDFKGQIPSTLCKLPHLQELWADCLGPSPEVSCQCPTVCSRGLPDPKQVDMRKFRGGGGKTGGKKKRKGKKK